MVDKIQLYYCFTLFGNFIKLLDNGFFFLNLFVSVWGLRTVFENGFNDSNVFISTGLLLGSIKQ